MPDYHTFTTTRTAPVSLAALNAALRAVDATAAVVSIDGQSIALKSNVTWTAPRIAAAQALLDSAAEPTAQVVAQRAVDAWPIDYRALVLALLDQINVLRAALPTPLAAITPAQAIAAIRAKAGTLS